MARRVAGRLATTSCLGIFAVSLAHADVNKSVAAGSVLLLGHFASVNPDCSPLGRTIVRISNAPAHGAVFLREGRGFSVFRGGFEHCSAVKVEGVSAIYRPQHGYIGADAVGLDVIYPSGSERTENFNITVK
jgi:hypothetical protein